MDSGFRDGNQGMAAGAADMVGEAGASGEVSDASDMVGEAGASGEVSDASDMVGEAGVSVEDTAGVSVEECDSTPGDIILMKLSREYTCLIVMRLIRIERFK